MRLKLFFVLSIIYSFLLLMSARKGECSKINTLLSGLWTSKINIHTRMVGRPTVLSQKRLLRWKIWGIIRFKPAVVSCLQAALILSSTGVTPSFSSISQEPSTTITSGDAENVILGKPRLVRRTGIVGVMVMVCWFKSQESRNSTAGSTWKWKKIGS